MSSFSSRWLAYAPSTKQTSETLTKPADKTDESPKAETALTPLLGSSAMTLPRLPWQLEQLIRAASSDLLPEGSTLLESGLVTDLNRYTLAWAAAYLTGDRDEVLSRLWQVRRAWQRETPS